MSSVFWQKTETNSWHRIEQLFVFSSFDHMLELEEASGLFVGLLHMTVRSLSHERSALTICLWFIIHGIVSFFFFFTDQKARSDLTRSSFDEK